MGELLYGPELPDQVGFEAALWSLWRAGAEAVTLAMLAQKTRQESRHDWRVSSVTTRFCTLPRCKARLIWAP